MDEIKCGFTVGINENGKPIFRIIGEAGFIELFGLLKYAELQINEPIESMKNAPVLEGIKALLYVNKPKTNE